jgi:hypothetical protein
MRLFTFLNGAWTFLKNGQEHPITSNEAKIIRLRGRLTDDQLLERWKHIVKTSDMFRLNNQNASCDEIVEMTRGIYPYMTPSDSEDLFEYLVVTS